MSCLLPQQLQIVKTSAHVRDLGHDKLIVGCFHVNSVNNGAEVLHRLVAHPFFRSGPRLTTRWFAKRQGQKIQRKSQGFCVFPIKQLNNLRQYLHAIPSQAPSFGLRSELFE